MSAIAKNRLKSTWTPLSREETNVKLFNERRQLVGKWFENWSNEQRKLVLGDLIRHCRLKQLNYVHEAVTRRQSAQHADFTRLFSRVISIYVFSFLDPRSLCRCARVCWYWNYLCELDQLWLPKCLRFGWYLNEPPSPHEIKAWKRLYIEQIRQLQLLRPKEPPPLNIDLDNLVLEKKRRKRNKNAWTKPAVPWKGSDPHPRDIWRYNYLENDDEADKIIKLRRKMFYGSELEKLTRNVKNKLNSGSNTLRSTHRSLSLSRLNSSARSPQDEKPKLAQLVTDGGPFFNKSMSTTAVHFNMPSTVASRQPPAMKLNRPMTATIQPEVTTEQSPFIRNSVKDVEPYPDV